MFKKCEICKRPWILWFFVKCRVIKPNEFMPLVKSKKKMCGRCFNKAKNYNFKVDGK